MILENMVLVWQNWRKMNFSINKSTEKEIYEHLKKCSEYFVPKLDSYIDLKDYSKKLHNKSSRYECYLEKNLVGMINVYLDKLNDFAFITNVSVLPNYLGKKISNKIINFCEKDLLKNKISKIILEVFVENARAISFYEKNGYKIKLKKNNKFIMEKEISRNYNLELKDTEDHKYAYNFDFDVIHHYMIKSFAPYFIKGNVLELGSFNGEFTTKLLPYFEEITCVEASNDAITIAKQRLPNNVEFINELFENLDLDKKFDNIILTHVLEHIDDAKLLLEKIKNNWLKDHGRLFIVCPNANAASRQIAVKMGLISHNSAITPSEKKHGHRITYSLDTLEKDVKESGLNVYLSSGIFFKALANFQWDKILNSDIISKEYLDGCFELGKKYPDLCSSIMVIAQK